MRLSRKEEIAIRPRLKELVVGKTVSYYDAFMMRTTEFVITDVTDKCVEGMCRLEGENVNDCLVDWPSLFLEAFENGEARVNHNCEGNIITDVFKIF